MVENRTENVYKFACEFTGVCLTLLLFQWLARGEE